MGKILLFMDLRGLLDWVLFIDGLDCSIQSGIEPLDPLLRFRLFRETLKGRVQG